MDINGIRSRGKLEAGLTQWFPYDWDFINKRQTRRFQCAYCGKFMDYKDLTEDHVYPKSKGGPRIVTSACHKCNNKKGDKLPIEWAIYAYENKLDL